MIGNGPAGGPVLTARTVAPAGGAVSAGYAPDRARAASACAAAKAVPDSPSPWPSGPGNSGASPRATRNSRSLCSALLRDGVPSVVAGSSGPCTAPPHGRIAGLSLRRGLVLVPAVTLTRVSGGIRLRVHIGPGLSRTAGQIRQAARTLELAQALRRAAAGRFWLVGVSIRRTCHDAPPRRRRAMDDRQQNSHPKPIQPPGFATGWQLK